MKKINKTNCIRSLISIILMITALFVIPGCTSPANQETPTGEETEEVEEEETQLSEFEKACEDIGIPHELGVKLKDASKTASGRKAQKEYDKFREYFEIFVYENGKGFVSFEDIEDSQLKDADCYVIRLGRKSYCIPIESAAYGLIFDK